MTEQTAPVMALRLIGGWLCLDFANTVSYRNPDTGDLRDDRLRNYADLVLWGQHTDVLTEAQALHLLEEGLRHPAEAEGILNRAKALREAIYSIFSAPLYDVSIPVDGLHILNTSLAEAMQRAQILEGEKDCFVWGWADDAGALDRVLWDVTRSAADLLTCTDRLEVRECEGDTCSWLFTDTSKNHRRRWCSMEECGNRAKVRKHRQKQRVTRIE